jgi:hypothetical protein
MSRSRSFDGQRQAQRKEHRDWQLLTIFGGPRLAPVGPRGHDFQFRRKVYFMTEQFKRVDQWLKY